MHMDRAGISMPTHDSSKFDFMRPNCGTSKARAALFRLAT